jgi:hypothetical protein
VRVVERTPVYGLEMGRTTGARTMGPGWSRRLWPLGTRGPNAGPTRLRRLNLRPTGPTWPRRLNLRAARSIGTIRPAGTSLRRRRTGFARAALHLRGRDMRTQREQGPKHIGEAVS